MRAAEFMRALADIISTLDNQTSDSSQDNEAQERIEKSLNDISNKLDNRPTVTTPAVDPEEKDENPIMVPPLQQHIELAKADLGKDSPVIKKLTQSEREVR